MLPLDRGLLWVMELEGYKALLKKGMKLGQLELPLRNKNELAFFFFLDSIFLIKIILKCLYHAAVILLQPVSTNFLQEGKIKYKRPQGGKFLG